MKRLKILICTIMRNQTQNISRWYNQLELLIKLCPEYDFVVSVYENDSTDDTKRMLKVMAEHGDIPVILGTEDIRTNFYGSVWSEERLRNLANARQKCIDQVGKLDNFDKIAFIEPDIEYDPNWCKELILANHPRLARFYPDVYSAWSIRSNKIPKESCFLYDTCATRQEESDKTWDFEKWEVSGRTNSLIQTHISDVDSNCLHKVYSTFNCFCVYNAEPFKRGLKWGYINKTLDTGQKKFENGWLDSDTAVICEDFREMGYGNIVLNTNCLVRHL